MGIDPGHPWQLSDEDNELIDKVREEVRTNRKVLSIKGHQFSVVYITPQEYEHLMDILGRWPDYMSDGEGFIDYSKPIKLNIRFSNKKLAAFGVENLLVKNCPVIQSGIPYDL